MLRKENSCFFAVAVCSLCLCPEVFIYVKGNAFMYGAVLLREKVIIPVIGIKEF